MVARGFVSPVHVVAPRNERNRLYVVEQRGTIRVVENGRIRPGYFLDLRGRVAGANEQGLLGLAFDPRHAKNRFGPQGASQRMGSVLGKMLRLNVRQATPKPVIIGLGLRNPWRYSFDRATGDLYIGDVGWRSREEVSFTPRARLGRLQNYGWEIYEGTLRLQEKARGPGALVAPIFEYDHDDGCTVVGGFVYRGASLPAERGRYVFGDFCEGTIWSLRVVGGRARDVRVEPVEIEQLTSFGENPAGELFATARDGTLYRLT